MNLEIDTAAFVKRARANLKLTQTELAEKLGLERRSIIRFEQGDELPAQTYFALRWLVRRQRERQQRARERAALTHARLGPDDGIRRREPCRPRKTLRR